MFLSFFVPRTSAQMRQVFQDNLNQDNNIRKVSFYSPSQGYVAFTDWIGFTSDSGRTFAKKYIALNNVDFNGYNVNVSFGFGISGVKAFNQDTIIAYGEYGLVPAILYSTNGGNSFKLVYHSQFDPSTVRTGIMDMTFPQNNAIGYAVDADRILKTTDRGLSWATVRTDAAAMFECLEAIDNNTVFAFSTGYNTNKLLRTTSGGAAWAQVTLPSGTLLYAYFNTADRGWINISEGGIGKVFYTISSGSSWVQKNMDPTPFSFKKMKFVNESTGYAIGAAFNTYKTTDSGRIWERLPRSNSFTYMGYTHNDLQYLSNMQLWAGGDHGLLELGLNGGGSPVPSAYFKVDTAGLWLSNTVQLRNYSKKGYQYAWYKNGALISTAYDASYVHNIYKLKDTIQLVVSNGTHADTATHYAEFYPPVVITAFSPATAGAGTTITLKGINFSDAVSVSFGGVSAASFQVVADTLITAVVSTSGASGNIMVITPYNRGATAGFTFIPAPVIAAFAPASATPGTTITITGSNFTGATAVSFGGVPAASFTVVSSSTIIAVLGGGSSGNVTVTTPGGTGMVGGFTIIPVITSFSPASGTTGAIITITGTGLAGVSGVSFGGVPAQSFSIDTVTRITAIVGAGATGDVMVTSPGGNASLTGFRFFLPPVISSFAPASGPAGTSVTISGARFSSTPDSNTVYFGAARAVVTAASATTLTVTVPAGATYSPLTVTVHNLTVYSQQPFTVTFTGGGTLSDSSFAAKATFPAGDGLVAPDDVKLADFDGDGKNDMAVANAAFRIVSVWHNTGVAGNISFTRSDYVAGLGPINIGIADIDGDGKLDMVVSYKDVREAAVIFRNTSGAGNISFASGITVNGAYMVSADLDLDGKPDLAGPNSIYRNTSSPGNISFTAAAAHNIGGLPLAVQDLDLDGKPDIIAINTIDDKLIITRNTSTVGNMSFATPANYSMPYPHAVTVGDIDGDSKPDITLASTHRGGLSVFRNTGAPGTIAFAPRVDISTGATHVNLTMNDLDGDGKPDVVLAHGTNNELAVYKNISDTGAISFAPPVHYPSPELPDGMTTGDVTGDGKPEIIVLSQPTSSISVFTNRVVPEPFISSFTPAIAEAGTVVSITGHNFNGVTGVSFGGVNAASFIINSPTSITATVGTGAAGKVGVTNAYGTGIRSGFAFGFPPVITALTPAAGIAGSSVTISGSRFSADPQSNIIAFGGVRANVLSATTNSLVVTVPPGSLYRPVTVTVNSLTAYTGLPFITTFPGSDSTFTATSFAAKAEFEGAGLGNIADMDGDGKLDLIFPWQGNNISIARNTSKPGNLSFAPKTGFAVLSGFNRSAVADMDGDGKQDLIVSPDNSLLSIFRNTGTVGNPGLAPGGDYAVGGAMGLATGDLDLDGKPDVVVVNYSGAIGVYRNISRDSIIELDRRIHYPVSLFPIDVALGDFDSDGRTDMAVVMSNTIAIYRNTSSTGAIAFTPALNITVNNPGRLQTADIDGDGKTDIVVNLSFASTVAVFKNTGANGNISFAAQQSFAIGDGAYYISAADLDGDGKPEVMASNRDANTISVLKNTSTPGTVSLLAKADYVLPDYTSSHTTGDMDGDGKPDLVTFHATNQLFIWRNQMDGSVLLPYCEGMDTSLTSRITGATYQWQLNTGNGFVNITNSAHVSGANTTTLHLNDIPASWNGYQFRCIAGDSTGIISCLSLQSAVMPFAEISVSASTICAGMPVTFTAVAVNAGAAPVWQWLINGKAVTGANSNVFTCDTLRNGSMVSAVVTGSAFCTSGVKDTSNVVTMQVSAPVPFSGKAGGPAISYINNTFTLTFTGNNVPAWEIVEVWESIDGAPFREIASYYYKGTVLHHRNEDNPTVAVKRYFFNMVPVADTHCFKAAHTDTVTIVIETPGPPTVVTVCAGQDTTLTSSLTGTSYQWQVRPPGSGFYVLVDNSGYSGVNTATLHMNNISAFLSDYEFRCMVDGNASDTIAFQVMPDISPAVTVSVAANPVCSATPVAFTATVVNAGASLEYIWQMNGLQTGANSSAYIANGVADGDQVNVIVTSRERCAVNPRDTSNTITLEVHTLAKPAVTQSNFTLTITNFDRTVAYKWQKLDSAGVWTDLVPAATDSSFIALKKGTYRASGTKGVCTLYSDMLTLLITGLEPVVNDPSGIVLYPNPVRNSLTLDSLKLSDKWETLDILGLGGNQPLATYKITGQTKVTIDISRLNNGYYLAVLRRKNGPPAVIRFIKL